MELKTFCSNTCGNNTNSYPGGGCARASHTDNEQRGNSGWNNSAVCTGPGHAILCPRCVPYFNSVFFFNFQFFFFPFFPFISYSYLPLTLTILPQIYFYLLSINFSVLQSFLVLFPCFRGGHRFLSIFGSIPLIYWLRV